MGHTYFDWDCTVTSTVVSRRPAFCKDILEPVECKRISIRARDVDVALARSNHEAEMLSAYVDPTYSYSP